MTIRVGVTGYSGTIGQELLKYPNFFPLVGDVRNPQEIEMSVKSEKPDLIVHLAFISDVDFCESKINFGYVTDVNVRGTFHVAEIAHKYNCGMMFMSSDHVFDGIWGNYREKNKPYPKNYYGLTKKACEDFREIFPFMKIVRTSYLLTHERVSRLIDELSAGEPIAYPTFMYRSFEYLNYFSESMYRYINNFESMPSILHISGPKIVSWYDFMRGFAVENGIDSSLVIPRTKEIAGLTPRPHKAGLNTSLSQRLGIASR